MIQPRKYSIARVVCGIIFAICALGFAPGASAQVLLGDQTIEPSQDSNTVGQAEAFQTTAALTGSIGSITVFVDATSASSVLFLGLYSDNAGHPGTLLTQGSISAPQTGAWNTIGVATTSVTAGPG